MNSGQRFGLAALLVALAAAVSVLAAPALPERIVSHYNAVGQPDATLPRAVGLAIVPAIAAGLLVLFWVLPRVDPLGENVAEFRASYDWFVVVLTAFLVVVHLGLLAFNLGYPVDVGSIVVVGVAAVFFSVGVVLGRSRRNWFVGIRTPWTLSSPTVWERTHAVGGRLFKLSALIALVGLVFREYLLYFVVVPVVLTAVATAAYSYVLYRRLGGEADDRPA